MYRYLLFALAMFLLINNCSPSALNRTRRQLLDDSAMEYVFQDLGTKAGQALSNMGRCSSEAGCHKGHCWTWCGWDLSPGGEWCYTTKAHSQSYDFVGCSHDYECDKCWKCGGPCTLF